MRTKSLILFLLLLGNLSFAGAKTDTVYFQSGDRITGELKSLENNIMRFSTSDAATIEVKWDRVDSVYIMQFLRIELINGELLHAYIYPTDSAGMDVLVGDFGFREVPHLDIVRVFPYHEQIFDRFDGAVSSGISYTKATDLFKFDFNGSAKYTADRYIMEANYNGSFQQQKDYERAERHNSNVRYMRLLNKKWFYSGIVSSERNSELGLDFRGNLGASFGNYLLFTNYTLLNVSLGAQANREFGVDTVTNNAEGVVSIRFSIFKYRSPKLSLTIDANLYPNMQDVERVRFDSDSNIRWELLKDFYLKFSLYYAYDRKPLSATASNDDMSTFFGIEYSF